MTLEEKIRRMKGGILYNSGSEELLKVQAECLEKMYDYNATRPCEGEKRSALIKQMFAEAGENCYIEPPFHANWGGYHTHLGKNVYANFNLTLVDDTDIYIGDYTMLGPNVVLATAGHPVCPELRARAYQYNLPVRIGKNCWRAQGW
ncbi:MAG: sugar O-acetyltransferase [Clostridia bacterium]|nr:sugar O-acetyltransferase [Clostridia bacterium]